VRFSAPTGTERKRSTCVRFYGYLLEMPKTILTRRRRRTVSFTRDRFRIKILFRVEFSFIFLCLPSTLWFDLPLVRLSTQRYQAHRLVDLSIFSYRFCVLYFDADMLHNKVIWKSQNGSRIVRIGYIIIHAWRCFYCLYRDYIMYTSIHRERESCTRSTPYYNTRLEKHNKNHIKIYDYSELERWQSTNTNNNDQ